MKMNTIRQLQTDEPASEGQSLGAPAPQSTGTTVTEVSGEDAVVGGGGGTGKDDVVNAGDLWAGDIRATGRPAGVRVAIVAGKSGNADGAKGDREANASSNKPCEEQPSRVPARDKQEGEDPWQRRGAERAVWSEKMLAALENGVKGNKWFSLIDKVARLDVLELAWAKVQSNAGACGVDGITVGFFAKPGPPTLVQPLLCRVGFLLPRRNSTLGNRQSPVWSKVLTGEPDAVIPPVRFGRGSGSNPLLPHPRNA
jgi:hypothetical protein